MKDIGNVIEDDIMVKYFYLVKFNHTTSKDFESNLDLGVFSSKKMQMKKLNYLKTYLDLENTIWKILKLLNLGWILNMILRINQI